MEETINIYLDQKDYSHIARGICGEEPYKPYIDIYSFLKNLLYSGRIKIYFSWTHIIESLRYYDLTGKLWKIHCDVVDTLTKGNCIIFPEYLEEREFEIFLSDHFGIKSQYSKSSYAFGFNKDAFPRIEKVNLPIIEELKDSIKKRNSTLCLGLSRNQRRVFLKKVISKNNLSNMSEDDFRGLFENGEKAEHENVLIYDILNFLGREKFINFLSGTTSYRSQIINEFIGHIFNFKTLVNSYSQIFPEIIRMAQFPDKSFEKINSSIHLSKLIQDITFKPAIDPDQFKTDFINDYSKSLRVKKNNFIKKHNLSAKEVENVLIKTNLISMPSIYSTIIFGTEYAKRHFGVAKNPRKPHESDVMDMLNLRNLPYVDLYVTDNFIADMVARIAKEKFNTIVFKNLIKLKEYLETV